MLTNIYYYNFYKPYMIKSVSSSNSSTATKRKIPTTAAKGENLSFQLNKALKTDVVQYAKDMTKYIVGLKDSAKNTVRDMEELQENIYEKGFDTAKEWLEEDMQEFTEGINQALDFSDQQQHSQAIKEFSSEISYILSDNAKELSEMGIQQDENGRLSFQKEKFDELSQSDAQGSLSGAVRNSIDAFRNIYAQTTDILTVPMSEHMHFKSLNYYYNYRLGSLYNDTFRIIEEGMIVDAVI